MNKLGILLLAFWLIISGITPLLKIKLPFADLILSILAVVGGLLLLLSSSRVRIKGKWAVIMLAVYLLLSGLIPLLSIKIPSAAIILGALATAAGILLLLER